MARIGMIWWEKEKWKCAEEKGKELRRGNREVRGGQTTKGTKGENLRGILLKDSGGDTEGGEKEEEGSYFEQAGESSSLKREKARRAGIGYTPIDDLAKVITRGIAGEGRKS